MTRVRKIEVTVVVVRVLQTTVGSLVMVRQPPPEAFEHWAEHFAIVCAFDRAKTFAPASGILKGTSAFSNGYNRKKIFKIIIVNRICNILVFYYKHYLGNSSSTSISSGNRHSDRQLRDRLEKGSRRKELNGRLVDSQAIDTGPKGPSDGGQGSGVLVIDKGQTGRRCLGLVGAEGEGCGTGNVRNDRCDDEETG